MQIEKVGSDCFTSPKWVRDICQATRWSWDEYRFYRHDNGGEPLYHKGATFLSGKLDDLHRKDAFLESWRKRLTRDLGSDQKFDQWLDTVAEFGTIDHLLFDLLIQGGLTSTKIESVVMEGLEKAGVEEHTRILASEKAKKDMLAFNKWVYDHKVEVYATEQMAMHPDLCTSTPIDVVCTGNFSPYTGADRQPCWALVNIKSSENKQNHLWQCAIEYQLALHSIIGQCKKIADLPVLVMTVRPKVWKDEPSYEVADYTSFATDIQITKAIYSTASMLKAAGHFAAPNVPLIHWEGPIIENTEFKFINFFQ